MIFVELIQQNALRFDDARTPLQCIQIFVAESFCGGNFLQNQQQTGSSLCAKRNA
jgi:hypothetical protein